MKSVLVSSQPLRSVQMVVYAPVNEKLQTFIEGNPSPMLAIHCFICTFQMSTTVYTHPPTQRLFSHLCARPLSSIFLLTLP